MQVPGDFRDIQEAIKDRTDTTILVKSGDHGWDGQLAISHRDSRVASERRGNMIGRWLLSGTSSGTFTRTPLFLGAPSATSCVHVEGGPWEFERCKIFAQEGVPLLASSLSTSILRATNVGGMNDDKLCSSGLYMVDRSRCRIEGGTVKNAKITGVRCADEAQCTAKKTSWRGNNINVVMSSSARVELTACRLGSAKLGCFRSGAESTEGREGSGGGRNDELLLSGCKVMGMAWAGDERPGRGVDARATTFSGDISEHMRRPPATLPP